VRLIVQHCDRLAPGDGKQARHLIEIVLWALKTGVELVSVQDPEMLAGGDMALLLGAIGGMRNHQDSKRKSASVTDGIRRRAVDRRQFVGGRRPYGYRHRDTTDAGRTTGPLVIVDTEAAIIRRIFGEYNAGRAQNAIARDLMFDGVPTLTEGGSWYTTTIAGMLKNPLYVGMVTHNGEHYPAVGPDGQPTHEPIIDRDTWETACQLREARQAEGRPRGRRTAGRHLLTEGLLRCTCGAAMSPITRKNYRDPNGKTYEAYECVRRLHHGTQEPTGCSQKPIKRELVDGAVYRYFEHVSLDLDATRAAVKGRAALELSELDLRQQEAESELLRTHSRLERVTRGWQDGVIDDAELARQCDGLTAEREAAAAQVEQHRRRRDEVEAALAS
jgi:site-specific DNA recombinase